MSVKGLVSSRSMQPVHDYLNLGARRHVHADLELSFWRLWACASALFFDRAHLPSRINATSPRSRASRSETQGW